ncbi:MAG: hypothetical protein H6842_03000 [Rhodospirillaceae bacterium]|nr:hypothetical protein [Rhodospirillaceae bacterium]
MIGRWAVAAVLTALAGGAAAAETLPSAGAHSCWGRVYSDTHLAETPGQRVREMRLTLVNLEDFDQVSFLIQVVSTEDANRLWITDGECRQDAGTPRADCYVWCDGGGFALQAEPDGDSLLLFNNGFVLSGCGSPEGSEDDEAFLRLDADPDHQVFRLYRLREEMCGGG